MPIKPPESTWVFPPAHTADEHGVVGIGADVDPGTLLGAYRSGMFPMPLEPGGPMAWWSPDPRGVLVPGDLSISRSLRSSCRRYEIRVDTAFSEVMAGCADPSRDRGWIDHRIMEAYQQLHVLGWAHSVEAWDEDGLAGGLYGVSIGGLFAGESMFHQRTDASKAALVGLVGILGDDPNRLIDVQWCTDHLAGLGAIEIDRDEYLECLPGLLGAQGPIWPPQRG
ncbi:MAG: leucyl/phenylalanyl-tRNA--protein transferase [Actinobacteria bacterium]|jgi:leucyl/phenylalanyl-tRNA--protein transferase|nr:leucyl/phenylalanyl-tRNA--protein transferase [Actinomycetota bacterium]MBT3687529.1 leucyl/phenylalanyl-tRNA--protein transferase [Actinomycetota bacterium]MBT4037656.1 leucyl/phenylalanyl-tRNA--protein transferase [Actinomycetota bacterium]MBT4278285.1 leucyl/phenylalanyl-tRNA--protein transferase [Actinomycetota bacterium]MBT4343626.1 leucyl/phenylalanyl-tRNA--protein transferase [Actinomycetota bacterium]